MTVGSKNHPFEGVEGFSPPMMILSPSSFAFSTKLMLVSLSCLLTIGPRSVSCSSGFPSLSSLAMRTNAGTNLSLIFSSTYILSEQMQVWPQFQNRAHMAHFNAQGMSASCQTMNGAFPPNSKISFGRWFEVCSIIVRPASVLPVIVIKPVILFVTSSSPPSDPLPVTTFTTPLGKPASSISSTIAIVLRGVLLDGFVTTVFPVISAGASFLATVADGKFHGVIDATTPIGNFRIITVCLGLSLGRTSPSILRANSASYSKFEAAPSTSDL